MKRYALLLLIFVMAIFGTGFETEMVNCADISSENSSDGNSINTIPMNEQVDAQNEIMSTETTSYDYVYLKNCASGRCLENGNYTTHVTPIVKDELDVVNETTKDEGVTIGYQMTFVPQVSSLGEGNNTDSYECVKLLYTNDSISSFMYYDELQDEGVELK